MKSIFKAFSTNREKEKEQIVNDISDKLTNNYRSLTPLEVTEIYNRVGVRIMEKNKQSLSNLIREAREYRDAVSKLTI